MKTETVLLAEIGEHEAERLAGLPPMHYGIHDPVVADIYAAPPTTYPDGSVLLKWGANTIRDRWVERPDEIAAWYRHGDGDDIVELMRPSMEATYPGIEVTGWRTHRCVVTYTGHGHTYIDAVEPGRLYLAVGGHGRSAKCADPLGALAASLVANDAWVDPLPADRFRAMYQGEVEDWPCRDLMADRPT
jgi:glycine/D-amino acid oxidase-like deaminating enzyme